LVVVVGGPAVDAPALSVPILGIGAHRVNVLTLDQPCQSGLVKVYVPVSVVVIRQVAIVPGAAGVAVI
jgi:hypothetical protein